MKKEKLQNSRESQSRKRPLFKTSSWKRSKLRYIDYLFFLKVVISPTVDPDCGVIMSRVMNHVGKNVKLGENVRMWHYTYIGDGAEIGDNTKIGSLVHIDYGVKIGRDCKIEGNAYIPPLTVIGDGVFVGPGAIFTNDPFPMSPKMVGVTIEDGCVICAGAVLKAGVRVGARSVVGMGSVVTRDVPPDVVVYGNPARVRYSLEEYLEKKEEWEKDHPI
jgi:acetyltransferase-like isoleucine patch superfamily enzyme